MNVIEFGLLDFVAGAFFPSQQSFYNENARSGRLGDDHLREMHPVSQSPPKWFRSLHISTPEMQPRFRVVCILFAPELGPARRSNACMQVVAHVRFVTELKTVFSQPNAKTQPSCRVSQHLCCTQRGKSHAVCRRSQLSRRSCWPCCCSMSWPGRLFYGCLRADSVEEAVSAEDDAWQEELSLGPRRRLRYLWCLRTSASRPAGRAGRAVAS